MIIKKLKKFLICILISMLLFTNIFTILPVVFNSSTYASGTDLENQTIITQNSNVTFDAFFLDGMHSTVQNMSTEPIIATQIQSTNGTLSNISIAFKDLNNSTDINYQLPPSLTYDTFIPTVDTVNNTINLNTTIVNSGLTLQIPLRVYSAENYKLEYLNKTTKVVLSATYTDAQGNQTPISHEIKVNIAWQENMLMQIGQRIERYIPYDIDGKKGVLVEIAIVSKLNTEGMYGTLPIKQTTLQVTAPQYAGVDPTSVNVIATRLLATNGETLGNTTFNTSNWNYDSTTRLINISVQNTEVNGSLYAGGGSDEFVITYDYPEAAYNLVDWTQGVQFESNVYGEIQYYSGSTVETTNVTDNDIITLKEQIGILETGPLIKSPFYLNSVDPTNNISITSQFTYSLHMTDCGDLATYKFVFHYENFKDELGTEYTTYINNIPYITYKTTRINKETFERVLGINGYIKIYDDSENYLGTINTSSPLNSDGYYTFDYTTTLGSVILETSVPIDFTNTLIVIHDKTILPTIPFTRQQFKEFTHLVSTVDNYSKLTTETQYTFGTSGAVELELKDTVSNAYLDITNSTLREAELNKEVIFNITLANNDFESDIYVNPVFQIDLPNYIESIDIKDVYVSTGPYFTIKDKQVIKRADGGLSIKITVDGTQLRIYTTPTQIEVVTDIKTKQVVPKLTEEVQMLYYNEHAKNYKRETQNEIDGLSKSITKVGLATSEINFVGTNDLECYCTITNFDDKNTVISSIESKNVGTIEVSDVDRIAKMNLNILNGQINSCEDIVILGRIPFQNNKSTISNKDLQSTFSTTIASQITTLDTEVSGKMTVYYSGNESATSDLNLSANGWTTNFTAENNFKSYLIKITDYELVSGNEISFSYDFKIPANVEYAKEVYANFGVYYTKEGETASKESSKIGLATQQPPEVSINKTVSVGNNTAVTVGDIIKYIITVKNTGEVDVKNLVVTDTIPQGTVYVEKTNGQYKQNQNIQQITENISLLEPGESAQVEFEVQITKTANTMTQIKNIATVNADGIENPIESPEVINPVAKQSISINKTVSVGNNTAVSVGDIIKYIITVKNTGEVDAKNLVVTDTIPQGTVYVERINGEYKQNQSIQQITENISLLKVGETAQIEFEVQITKTANAITQIRNIAIADGDGLEKPIESPEVINPVTKQLISITKTSSVAESTYIKEGENFEYYIKIQNISGMKLEKLRVTDILPEGITYVQAYNIKRNSNNGTYTETTEGITYDEQTKTVSCNIDELQIDEIIEVKIIVKANQITDGSNSKKIQNSATITGDEINKTTPKVINYIANIDVGLKKEADIQEYRIKKDTDIKYTITLTNNSPIALQDLNIEDELSDLVEFKDAYIIGENGEQIKQGVNYSQASHTVTWKIDQIEANTTKKVEVIVTTKEPTDEQELFKNIATVTGKDINPTNSNEIEKVVIKENEPVIDLDLEFDLAVDKAMKKIKVKNSKQEYTNTYNGAKITKIEIADKLLNETTIEIEYEITVVNQGNIPGYAKKIVDYIPAGTTFNPKDNVGWTLENGNLYYTGLEDEIINPGENKTVSLTLVKKTSENNVGSIINSAEMYEDYNEEGLDDINSTPNNKDNKENDFSKAEVIISIKTGQTHIYIELIIASLAILSTGIIFIKKKVI